MLSWVSQWLPENRRGQKDEKPENKEQRTQEWNKAGLAEVCPPVTLGEER